MHIPFLIPKRFLELRIDPTGRCNLRCKMCYYRYQEKPYPTLPLEKLQWIAREFFPRARSLQIGNSAEPLLYPQLPELLNLAKKARVPEIRFITNGTLLDRKKSELLVDSGVFAVTVSMDAASEELFAELRCGAKLSDVVSNLETLVQVKKEKRSSRPRVQMNFVIMRSNIHELPRFIELASRFEPSEINAYFAHLEAGCPHEEEIIDGSHPDFPTIAEEAARIAKDKGIVLHLPYLPKDRSRLQRFTWSCRKVWRKVTNRPFSSLVLTLRTLTYLKLCESRSYCWYPNMLMTIKTDYRIVPCCAWGDEGLGPIEGLTFDQTWSLPEFKDLRESLLTRESLPPNCQGCPEATSRKVF